MRTEQSEVRHKDGLEEDVLLIMEQRIARLEFQCELLALKLAARVAAYASVAVARQL